MSHHIQGFRAVGPVMAVTLIWFVSGCSERPMPLQPSSPPQINLLQRTARGKAAVAEAWLAQTKPMNQTLGGTISLGNDEIGYSTLTVPPGALAGNTNITMKVSTSGPVVVEFGPDGTHFDLPITVTVSYRAADLTGVNESVLKVYYNNGSAYLWEEMPSASAPASKVVSATLTHFSQYAVGSEDGAPPPGGGG